MLIDILIFLICYKIDKAYEIRLIDINVKNENIISLFDKNKKCVYFNFDYYNIGFGMN